MEQNCVTVALCINKGDIRTFNINNEEEKHKTMKRKKQRVGRKNNTMMRNDRTKYTETNID